MATVFVYGFPPGMEMDAFKAEFFENHPEAEYCKKIDFKKEKIFAFIHTNTEAQANELISTWNQKSMRDNGENVLQCRLKTDGGNSGGQQGNRGQPRGQRPQGTPYNYGNQNQGNFGNRNQGMQMGGHKPRYQNNNQFQQNQNFQPPNNFQPQQNSFRPQNPNPQNQNSRFNQQSGDAISNIGPQKPVLYVYGFPKEMSQEDFEKTFLDGCQASHKQTDYFQEKLYCFMHLHDIDTCDNLIEKWDQQKLPGYEAAKPLQVRYKGLDSNIMRQLQNITPVLWVYGFPKNTTEESFIAEFLNGMEVEKVDFFQQKLYAFVHLKSAKNGLKLINKWEGKLMAESKNQPLQVRFKSDRPNNKGQNQGGNQNGGMMGGGGHHNQGGHNQGGGHHNNNFNNQGGMGDMSQNQHHQQHQQHPNQNQMYGNPGNFQQQNYGGFAPASNMGHQGMRPQQMNYNQMAPMQNHGYNMGAPQQQGYGQNQRMNNQYGNQQNNQNRGNWNNQNHHQNQGHMGNQMQMGHQQGGFEMYGNQQNKQNNRGPKQNGGYNNQHQNFGNQMNDNRGFQPQGGMAPQAYGNQMMQQPQMKKGRFN